MSKKDFIILILILIILGLCIIISDNSNQVQDIKNSVINAKARQAKFVLLKNRGALAIFDSAPTINNDKLNTFVLDSVTGKLKPYCADISSSINHNDTEQDKQYYQKQNNCALKIVNFDKDFLEALNATKKTIFITVNDGKKDIILEMHEVLISARKGSYCSTSYVAGRQYEKCVTLQEECTEYRDYDFPSYVWTHSEFLEIFPECKGLVTE